MRWSKSFTASAAAVFLAFSGASAKDEVEDTMSSHIERVRFDELVRLRKVAQKYLVYSDSSFRYGRIHCSHPMWIKTFK
jgi:hypothetical protein